jgi:D-3-phosphoglycerate dehydrogenase
MAAVVVLEPLAPEADAVIRAHATEVREGLAAPVAGAAAIITRGQGRLTSAVLRAAGPSLRCVARVGAGTDNIDVAAATALGIPVFYAPDAFTAATAEHALALLLAMVRRIAPLDAAVRAGGWAAARAAPRLTDLAGQRMGIVGLGRIGRRFGELAQALGMEVVAWSRSARDARFPHADLDLLLRTSDVVSLHLSLNAETQGFLSAARIAALKPGAFVLNVARGALVDEAALAEALRAGRLGGAALDVLSEEPPPAGHPLIGLPNVLLTPHVGALTGGAFRDACLQVARAVVGHLRGDAADPAVVRNPGVLRG